MAIVQVAGMGADAGGALAVRPTLLEVLAIVAMNGCATELVRCVNICKGARANIELWERVVDLPHSLSPDHPLQVTRLGYFALMSDVTRVRKVLDRGARVGLVTSTLTALHLASSGASTEHTAVVNALLDAGAKHVHGGMDGDLPLHTAAGAGSVNVITALLVRGAPIDGRSSGRSSAPHLTPLMVAAANGRAAAAALLLRAGADADAVDDGGITALLYAVANDHAGVVAALVGAGCAVDSRMVAVAVMQRNAEISSLLVSVAAIRLAGPR